MKYIFEKFCLFSLILTPLFVFGQDSFFRISLPGKSASFTFNGVAQEKKYSLVSNDWFINNTSPEMPVESRWSLCRTKENFYIGFAAPDNDNCVYEIRLCGVDGNDELLIILSQKKLLSSPGGVKMKQLSWSGQWCSEIEIPDSVLGKLSGSRVWKFNILSKDKEQISKSFKDHDNVLFAELKWDEAIGNLNLKYDLSQFRKGTFSAVLAKPVSSAEFKIGVMEFVPDINDANTKPAEKFLSCKKSADSLQFGPAVMPERCTVYIHGRQNGRSVIERGLFYDKRRFLPFSVNNVCASLDHNKELLAEVLLGISGKNLFYELSLSDSSGRKVTSVTGKASGKQQVKVPIAGVVPGKYIFTARLLDQSKKELQKITGPFTVFPEKPEWWGNRLGMSDGEVPAPWTPIQIRGESEVKVWGRTYKLDRGGLPAEISGKTGIIARNLRFVSGKRAFKGVRFKWIKRAADVAEFESELALDGHRIKLRGTMEFDGMLWLNPEFIPAPGRRFPSVSYVYDALKEHAKLSYCGEHLSKFSGVIKPEGWSKRLLGHTTFWIGNDYAGLYFFTDDLRDWNVSDLNAVKVKAGPLVNNIRKVSVPLLESAVNEVNKNYSLEFGILATPSRPLPVGYRNWQINGGYKATHHFYAKGMTSYFNVPVPLTDHAMAEQNYWRKREQLAPVYLAFLFISPFTDEYRWFAKSWSGELHPHHRYQPVNPLEHYLICPKAPGYNDYYIAKLDEMLKKTKADGIYFDYMQPDIYPCKGVGHNCLWKKDGKFYYSNRMRASRELAKRIYILMKRHNPDGFVVFHNSSGISPAIHAFCDVTWSGEHTTRRMYNRKLSYHDIFELEKYRIEFSNQLWGVPRIFLPQYLRAVSLWNPNYFGDAKKLGWNGVYKAFCDNPAITRDTWYLAAYILAHDSDFSGDWGMWERQIDITKMRKELGWDDSVRYHAYFDPATPFRKITPADSSVIVSAFEAAKGWKIIVLNDTDQSHKVSFTLPDEIVKSLPLKAVEKISGKDLDLRGKIVSLDLKAREPRFILIYKK